MQNKIILIAASRLFQFFIIMVFFFAGRGLAAIIPLPISGTIYGLVLLFVALSFKIIPLRWVDKAADFVLFFLGLFFVAPTVGLMEHFERLWHMVPALILIIVATLFSVILVVGKIADKTLNKEI